jgi:hypothetical protein
VPLRAKPGRPAHNTVGTARLTCGQPRDHRLFPQVTAKREDLTRQNVEVKVAQQLGHSRTNVFEMVY